MTALEPARGRPRAFWADMRFFLGIVLVIASVAGVWFVVSASRQTMPVFAAARTIVPGEALSADDMRLVDVALGQVGDAYLAPDALADGLIAVRTIESGELVPQSAVGDEAQTHTTSVVLRSAVDVPASVQSGTVVEVWAALRTDDGYDEPRILVADATVVSVTRDDSMIGAGSAALELVIGRSEVAAMLAAMADESALSVVPTGSAR
jgi:SAF domain